LHPAQKGKESREQLWKYHDKVLECRRSSQNLSSPGRRDHNVFRRQGFSETSPKAVCKDCKSKRSQGPGPGEPQARSGKKTQNERAPQCGKETNSPFPPGRRGVPFVLREMLPTAARYILGWCAGHNARAGGATAGCRGQFSQCSGKRRSSPFSLSLLVCCVHWDRPSPDYPPSQVPGTGHIHEKVFIRHRTRRVRFFHKLFRTMFSPPPTDPTSFRAS